MPNILIVDNDNNPIGSAPKAEARAKGLYHRIARVILKNSKGEILMQRRGENDKDMGHRWDQSAAGHVDEGEESLTAAYRELEEEIGIKGIELTHVGTFQTENINIEKNETVRRFNDLYIAKYDGNDFKLNPREVAEIKWMNIDDLIDQMKENSENFTKGFVLLIEKYEKEIKSF